MDHASGQILAYVLADHKDSAFLQLQTLLEPLGKTFYTDGWGGYERYLDSQQHGVGMVNTQKIERKHLNERLPISQNDSPRETQSEQAQV